MLSVSHALTLWLAAVAGQSGAAAPAEAAWLKAVPADAELVVRLRAPETVRDDLVAMLRAMSPALAEQARPLLDQGVEALKAQLGPGAGASPMLVVMELPEAGAQGLPPFVALLQGKDYAALQTALASGSTVKPRAQPGGYDALTMPDGSEVYTARGSGFLAFGTGAELVGAVAKPQGAGLDGALAPALKARLLGGDLGVYADLAAVQKRYGDQLDQARQSLQGALAQGGPQGAAVDAETAQAAVAGAFDALKSSRNLALHLDFGAEGLRIGGLATVAPDSAAAKSLAAAKLGTGTLLARMPADALGYVYASVGPASYQRLQRMQMSFLAPGGEPGPALKAALDLQAAAGPREAVAATDPGAGGVKGVKVVTFADPRKGVASLTGILNAAKAEGSAKSILKDVVITPQAQTYRGFALAQARITFDLDKVARSRPNVPNAGQALKALMGESVTLWYGTDGKLMVQVAASSWDEARAQLDTVLTGQGGLGKVAAYQALRSKLAPQVSRLFLLSAQGLVRQVATGLSAMTGAKGTVPADLPKEPALLGAAATASAAGLEFQAVVPSDVGPVIENGLLPLLQGLQGQATQ